ncbi:MAG: hypothetical protein AB7F40_08460 [Victivallaceae bacterium]|nr:hypothetical protein [Victivallaceae bacterium]
MKIKLVGKNLDDIRPVLAGYGLLEAEPEESPDMVVAHGGDGTLLLAEQEFPALPKLPLRDAGTAPLCAEHSYDKQLTQFVNGHREITLLPKLRGETKNDYLLGINDVFIHNADRVGALRYRVWIDGELYANEIVGDGVGVSTVHGSTAYYRSITRSVFKVGMGLAFSNSTAEIDHLVVKDTSIIEVEIVRGPGLLVADNSPHTISLDKDDRVRIFRSGEYATIYNLDAFMCPCCRLLRHPTRFEEKVLRAARAGCAGGSKC